MSPEEFVSSFDSIEDLAELRREDHDDKLPPDPEFYLGLTTQLFPRDDIEDLDLRQRFVIICNQFLFRDGRTFLALWHVVKMSLVNDEISRNGVNALAGISCYLDRRPILPLSALEMRSILTDCLSIGRLNKSASACLKKLESYELS